MQAELLCKIIGKLNGTNELKIREFEMITRIFDNIKFV